MKKRNCSSDMLECKQEILSKITRSRNKFHKNNCYIDFDVDDIKSIDMKNIFRIIADEEKSNLQIMIPSSEVAKSKILEESGFEKVRICYVLEVSKGDLLQEILKDDVSLNVAKLGTVEYKKCSQLLFNYYVETHKNINPLTSTFEEFVEDLPEMVFYAEEKGRVIHCAFVEENEIAYVSSKDKETFKIFILSLVKVMFEEQETVSFEADNVDWAAMELKNLFIPDDRETYDTWIFKTTTNNQNIDYLANIL